jgi:hypothetical protein
MAEYYSESSQINNVCVEATKVFSAVLESLRKSSKKSIKILEVGAGLYSVIQLPANYSCRLSGTGLFTHRLVHELKRNSDLMVEYTVTDISYAVCVFR